MREKYNFNISLSVLNHLGRNLYRNIITVIGEAISNSWDADASNVWIIIDKDHDTMSILDDGQGMTDEDFQEKFLKIGYSKRKKGQFKSCLGRPYIGRKGIGKLALLSCAERIHIATKAKDMELTGGVIDNSGLDEAIEDDLNSHEYILDPLSKEFIDELKVIKHGTFIMFESVKSGIFNTIDYIKKAIALYFRFSLIDQNFNIYINDELINESMLEDFSSNTQFLWEINDINDPFVDSMKNLQEKCCIKSNMKIRGYIATVKKPSNLKVRGTQEKLTLDLFVNGRLRERDILRHIPTARIVENYVFGQIHFDELDRGDNQDVFTSSREGVISDSEEFNNLIDEIDRIFKIIIDEWDEFRRRNFEDGDPENKKISSKERKAQELFNTTLEDMQSEDRFVKRNGIVEEWAKELLKEAQFNIPSYTECFIAENLLRRYVNHSKLELTEEACNEAKKWAEREEKNKEEANISYDVRSLKEPLFYLDMKFLANLIDKVPSDKPKTAGLSRSAIVYKPMRDAVGHTSLLTPIAKQQLTLEYENIKARLAKLLTNV